MTPKDELTKPANSGDSRNALAIGATVTPMSERQRDTGEVKSDIISSCIGPIGITQGKSGSHNTTAQEANLMISK